MISSRQAQSAVDLVEVANGLSSILVTQLKIPTDKLKIRVDDSRRVAIEHRHEGCTVPQCMTHEIARIYTQNDQQKCAFGASLDLSLIPQFGDSMLLPFTRRARQAKAITNELAALLRKIGGGTDPFIYLKTEWLGDAFE